jgi:hypothetical protein
MVMTRKKKAIPLEVGCVVYLRSGSQRLTVASIDGDMAEVIYSVFETREIKREKLPVAALDVIQAAPEKEME